MLGKKPKSSQIKLIKNSQEIAIFIPNLGVWDTTAIFVASCAISWNSVVMVIPLILLAREDLTNLIVVLSFSFFWIIGLILIYFVLLIRFRKTYFKINQENISLTYELFGFRWQKPKPAPRNEINKLEFRPKYYAKNTGGNYRKCGAKLIIYAGTKQYQFSSFVTEITVDTGIKQYQNSTSLITELELQWLAVELSRWLGLPLDTVKLALNTGQKNSYQGGKPHSSKIKLNKHPQAISIFIPPYKANKSLFSEMSSAIYVNSFTLLMTLSFCLRPWPEKLLVLFTLTFWNVGLLMSYQVLFPLFGTTYLVINQNTISLNQELFGFHIQRLKPTPKDHIDQLEFIPEHDYEDSDGDHKKNKAKLIIYLGRKECELTEIASEIELKWLAEELGQWLNIPVINHFNSP